MARVFTQRTAKLLGLPGRTALEIVSGDGGVSGITLRRVEIPVDATGDLPRSRHMHNDFEECMYVLAGEGMTEADSGNYAVKAGDAIVIPSGEKHATRNTGSEPLVLLCFFPVGDIRQGTAEPGVSPKDVA
ncbi:MAG TPA: cupin domain-containing protein [Candidatus Acidoferrum sp.]|jgi:mannose-6-phosphate isomerase-like protein (cupin superfamily)|nr:cupin domain-containing protein [Candidatus Acidoferrum sp.]